MFAPFLAELVSGSTPPQAWVLPQVFLAFAAIYGLSALVIREFTLRIGGGPATMLLLGLAFGIVNEGMAAHSLFNPNWPAVGVLGSYGRWAGVNWLWAEWIVPFHAVWSISFPIFLVGQFWPGLRRTRFLSDRWVAIVAPVPVVVSLAVGAAFEPYPLTLGDVLAMLAVVGGLVLLAWRCGPVLSRWHPFRTTRPSAALAVLGAATFFLAGQVGTWQTPRLGPYPEVGFVLIAVLFLALATVTTSWDRDTPAGVRAAFAATLTGVGFYTLLSPLSEFVLGRIGLVPIDVIVWGGLYLLYRRRTRPNPSLPRGDPGPTGPAQR